MRLNRIFMGLGLFLVFLLAAEQAYAHASCVTRNKCRWWAKKYTATVQVGCYGYPLPLCYSHSGDCDWTANLSCGWRNCLWGGGDARASNGPSGCHKWTHRSGQGFAGDPTATEPGKDDQGGHDIYSRAEFDDAARAVTIHLDRGEMTALDGGMAGRLDVYVLREDEPEGIKEGDEVADPMPTPTNTFWHGSVVLRNGRMEVAGFDPDAFQLSKDENGISRVTFENVSTVQKFDVTDEEFANFVVLVIADEE